MDTVERHKVVRKYHDWSDRELLAVLVDRSDRHENLLLGNGQVGLVEELAEVKGSMASSRAVKASVWTAVVALIGVVGTIANELLL